MTATEETTITPAPAETLEARIEREMDALGADADQVADALRRRGITGVKCWANTCPMANFIAEMGEGLDVWVSTDVVDVYREDTNEETKDGSVFHAAPPLFSLPLPEAVSDFVDMFDAGGYPDMVLEPEPPTPPEDFNP